MKEKFTFNFEPDRLSLRHYSACSFLRLEDIKNPFLSPGKGGGGGGGAGPRRYRLTVFVHSVPVCVGVLWPRRLLTPPACVVESTRVCFNDLEMPPLRLEGSAGASGCGALAQGSAHEGRAQRGGHGEAVQARP
eukprot:1194921-Prorocentrum_minimum.AAC.3